MSRSTAKAGPVVKSPVKHWLSWKGDTGSFVYWDGEKNVSVETLDFLLLDRRQTVTGWCDEKGGRMFSNVVKSLKEELNVRVKQQTVAKGLWEDIKEEVNKAGGNYTANLYAVATINGERELVCVQLDKGCLKEWTDFIKDNPVWEIYKGMVRVERGEKQKKGKVEFYFTKFTLVKEVDEELEQQAKLIDLEELQPYFNGEAKEEEKAPF
jgi:hypothetical protein